MTSPGAPRASKKLRLRLAIQDSSKVNLVHEPNGLNTLAPRPPVLKMSWMSTRRTRQVMKLEVGRFPARSRGMGVPQILPTKSTSRPSELTYRTIVLIIDGSSRPQCLVVSYTVRRDPDLISHRSDVHECYIEGVSVWNAEWMGELPGTPWRKLITILKCRLSKSRSEHCGSLRWPMRRFVPFRSLGFCHIAEARDVTLNRDWRPWDEWPLGPSRTPGLLCRRILGPPLPSIQV